MTFDGIKKRYIDTQRVAERTDILRSTSGDTDVMVVAALLIFNVNIFFIEYASDNGFVTTFFIKRKHNIKLEKHDETSEKSS